MRAARKRQSQGLTKYKHGVLGDAGNYRWPVTLDYNEDGYLGISQIGLRNERQRVLLSPGQLAALKAFTRRRPTGRE